MSLFGKLKSAVMGNPVTREFELEKHIASAGPGLLWKVYSGFKKNSRHKVSIFVFDKKAPELEKLPKKQKEAVYEMLKKGPTYLIKLRHPRLLTVEHQVEESGDTLAFVTEPIFSSLANLLGHYDNMPTPLPLIIKEHQLHPIEIQYGLIQVAEALSFLHSDVKMMHGNLTPQNVVVNSGGNWKVMGFNFSCYSHYQSEAQTSFVFREWDTRKPLLTNPSLDFLAPEYVLSKSCGTPSDVYSYGMLSQALYNGGRPLFQSNNNMLSFKQNVEQVSRMSESALGGVPADYKPLVRSMLAVEPSVRPDALEISKHSFFDEVGVNTLLYLGSLCEKKDMEKSQFFKKNLARVITKLPKRIAHQRVLPPLRGEFRNPKMIPFVLPLVLLIAEDCTLNEYSEQVFPVLAPAMRIQDPIQIPLIFLQKMDLLLKMTPQDKVQQHVLPMITQSLEAKHSQLQELCVDILPSFASMVDYSSMKHSIVPRITSLCLRTKERKLCVKCLVCLGLLLDVLDKHIVKDLILPTLHQIPSREPGVLMAILGIFHQTLTKPKLGLEKKVLAETIIPFLMPLSIEPALNLKQFDQFMKVIREMLVKVETEQQAHLDQLSKMEEQTKSTVQFAMEVSETKAMDDAINRLEGMFTPPERSEEGVAPRRGDITSSKSGSVTASTSGGSSETNFLSGMRLSDLSATFSSNSSFPRTSEQPPAIPSASNPSPSLVETLQPTKPGYHPPPLLQPQLKAENVSSGNDLLTGIAGRSSPAGRGSNPVSQTESWATGILAPNVSHSSKPASNWSSNVFTSNSASLRDGKSSMQDSSSIFSGIGTNSSRSANQKPPNSSGMFGGMDVNQSPGAVPRRDQQSGTISGEMAHQPSVPVQTGHDKPKDAITGWSTGIKGSEDQVGMGHGQNWNANSMNLQAGGMQGQQNSAQWSGYGGTGSGSESVSGWSQGMQAGMGQQYGQMNNSSMGMGQQYGQMNNSSMGMGQQHGQMSNNMGQQYGQMNSNGPGSGMRMGVSQPNSAGGLNQQQIHPGSSQRNHSGGGANWSSNIQAQQQVQPVGAASLMMGGAQPLIPNPGGVDVGGGNNSTKPAPGANPFADLNFT